MNDVAKAELEAILSDFCPDCRAKLAPIIYAGIKSVETGTFGPQCVAAGIVPRIDAPRVTP